MKTVATFLIAVVCGAAGAAWAGTPPQIATQAECEAKGGFWMGSQGGRGVTTGCDLPTRDAGKPCNDSSQCEGRCIPKGLTKNGVPQHAFPNAQCVCSRRSLQRKGHQVFCTKNGIISRMAD